MEIFTYQDFKNKKEALTFSKCERIFFDLVSSLDKNDEMVNEILEEFIPNCIRYSESRKST